MPRICIFLLFTILISVTFAAAQSDLGSGTYRSPYSDLYSGSPLQEFHADILDSNRPPNTKDTMVVDFASREITFARMDNVTGMPLWEFHYGEIEDFLRDMENHTLQSLWDEIAREKGKSSRTDNQPKRQGLTFAMPAHLPRWATRILGNEPPKLSITGTQKLLFGVNRNITGTVNSPDEPVVSPEFKPTSNFSIKGSVGRLLHIEINLQGETGKDDFFEQAKDQLSQVKIHYREQIPGELEDDIIQEVEIGKTSFQMPGQGLAGFSTGSNENLWGIKVRSKFGPLELTTIASIENVETSRKTINGNESRTDTISETAYIKNQFFYLDEKYKQFAEGTIASAPKIETGRIQVLKKIPGREPGENIKFAYYENGDGTFQVLKEGTDYKIDVSSMTHLGMISFTNRLSESDVIGVIWHSSDGIINKSDTNKTDISVKTDNGWITVPAYNDLWILKKDSKKTTDPTYNLMLRNVYYVGTSDAVNFELNVFRSLSDNTLQDQNEIGTYFTDILGLSTDNVINREDTKIFDLENGYMFIPPFKTEDNTLNRNWAFTNPLLGETRGETNTNDTMYNDEITGQILQLYKITTKSKRRMERFNLDFGIVEGSERFWTPSGDSLVRNIDYTIDYGFGTVVLISPKARAANILEASYQKESLFLLDKKVFVGINGKIDFPGIGRNSYWSTTAMWQIMDAKKMMPRVGTEPYNRFLFDSNLRFDFAPLWMTTLINYIPGIEREAPSSATFDFEVAHSSVKNSARSGGEAYIDNFSSSAKIYSLGTAHTAWHKAGPDLEMLNSFHYNPPAWHHYWFQPAEGDSRAFRREIYPLDPNANNRDHNDRMNTLRLMVQPYPDSVTLQNGVGLKNGNTLISVVKPWAGISYGLSGDLRDRTEDKFFEFWIKALDKDGNSLKKGTLTIDFGTVGEDLSLDGKEPNKRPDIESPNITISEEYDLGLDVVRDGQINNTDGKYIGESWFYPQFKNGIFDVWRELGYQDPLNGEWIDDPARDNWELYDRNHLNNRKFTNGTQGNLQINPRPDKEDIDDDGAVTLEDGGADYFRYTIDMATITKSPFYNDFLKANEPDSGWIHIRIPVGASSKKILEDLNNKTDDKGNIVFKDNTSANWNNVRHVRILWKDMEKTVKTTLDSLEFEGIQFVGNQWREQPKESSDITGAVTVSVLDSRTDPNYIYVPGKNLDSLAGEEATDYSLRIEFNEIPNGKDSAVFVSRRFDQSQSLDLTNYRTIKFFAMENDEAIKSTDNNWLILRMGNGPNTYYEFKTNRLVVDGESKGWKNPGGFEINLEDLTDSKLGWFNTRGERHNGIDTTWGIQSGTGSGSDSLRVFSETKIMPTLSNITWIAFGVENNSGGSKSFDVRLNGFRAAGISDYSGWAVRASMKLNWSDFMENSANFRYTDANFRSMADDVLKESSAQISSGFGTKIQLDKFLPDRFGVQIPLGGEMSTSLQRPETRPNSDISLRKDDGKPDGISDMAGDFGRMISGSSKSGNVTESEKYERRGKNRSAYTGYRKNKTSERVIPRLTADRIGFDYRLSYRDSTARMGEIPNDELGKIQRDGFNKYHAEINTSQQHNAGLDYNFSPSKKVLETLSWSPFKNAKSTTLSRKIKTMSFNLLPERVVFDIAKVNYAKRDNYSSIQDVIDTSGQYGKNKRPVEEMGINHALNITYKPINPFLTMNYNLGIDRNFDRYLKDWDKNGIREFASSAVFRLDPEFGPYNVLFSEQRRNQDMKISFTPEITRWLTLTSNMSGGYTQNMELSSDTSYMRTIINSTFDISSQIYIRRLFEDVSRAATKNEKFSNGMENIAKGMEAIGLENISFRYNTSMGLDNSFLQMDYLDYGLNRSTAKYLLYSFGLYNRSLRDFFTGSMNDSKDFGGVQNRNDWFDDNNQKNASDTRNTTQGFTISTSLKTPNPVEININTLSLGWTKTYSVTPEVDRLDTAIVFPDIRIGLSSSAMEQMPFIKEYFSTFRLDWGFTRRVTKSQSGMPSEKITHNHSIAWGFTPLIKLTAQLKRIDLDLSYTLDLGFDTTDIYDKVLDKETNVWAKDTNDRQTQKQIIVNSWTANYHIDGRRGRTIRLFRDQIIEIDGDIDFSVTLGISKQKNRYYPKSFTGESDNSKDTKINFLPQVAYKFTRNIDARLFYELQKSVTGKDENLNRNGRVAMEVTISF